MLIPQVKYMFTLLVVVSLSLYIRYISYEHKFVGEVFSEKEALKMVEILLKIFFPIEKLYWFLQDMFLVRKLRSSNLRLCWFSTLVKVNVTCYKTSPLVYCTQANGSWNTRTRVYPGLENELVLTYMSRRKAEKDLTSWNMLEKKLNIFKTKNSWWVYAWKNQNVIVNLKPTIIFPKQEDVV